MTSAAAGVLRHIQRVLVAHVDDRGADLDAFGARADGGQEREGRAELAGVVMHAEESAVGAELLGGDSKLDGLQSASDAVRTFDCGDGVQWPKERKPIFFMRS